MNTLLKHITHTSVYTYIVPVQTVTLIKNIFVGLTLYITRNISCGMMQEEFAVLRLIIVPLEGWKCSNIWEQP